MDGHGLDQLELITATPLSKADRQGNLTTPSEGRSGSTGTR